MQSLLIPSFCCVDCALRADYVINIAVYRPQTGGSGGIGSAGVFDGGGDGASTDRHQSSGLRAAVSRKVNTSIMEKSRVICRLMCADSEVEMESRVKELNGPLEVLQYWMPKHFDRVARYDSSLTFAQPVVASMASRLKQS
ncbi:unnamed protein product [Taenia asiatica]|uniref:NPH3 domain-containing protein n=1 Tax=Taenia asiatica TaxID=60517 RepID=A0A158RAJ7_TAEAS|nr:unnamed protein product [Taenia asiatica]